MSDTLTAFRDCVRDLAVAHGFVAGDDDSVAQWIADELTSRAELRATVAMGEALAAEMRTELAVTRTTLEQVTGERDRAVEALRAYHRANPSAD